MEVERSEDDVIFISYDAARLASRDVAQESR
jgi:hypothetical protein